MLYSCTHMTVGVKGFKLFSYEKRANRRAVTINELRIIRFIMRGLRLTVTAAATVANRLPPKYMYVSRTRCFTMSGHILNKHAAFTQPVFN